MRENWAMRPASVAAVILTYLGAAATWGISPANGADAIQKTRSPVKNFLFIVSDDLKASVLGCYGAPVCRTPNIDRLAREGLLFDRAYCQGTWCAPSRQSFMFSRYHGAGKVNLGQHFRENGWYSARVGKIYHMRVPGDIIAGTDGNDVASSWTERFNSAGQEAHSPGPYACLNLNTFTSQLEDRQSTGMPHRMFVSVQCEGNGADQPDYKSASKANELLELHRDGPFFLAVGLVRPHYPMVAPRPFFDRYPWQDQALPDAVEDDLQDVPRQGQAGTLSSNNPIGRYPDNQRRMWTSYFASVSFMDEQVGRIVDELERLNLRESTAIVFTSDHGYHLGEHGFWQKNNLHEEVVRVPLIISVPGYRPGKTQSIVELVDIFPTLAAIAGLPLPDGVQGKDLTPILNDHNTIVRDGALSFDRGNALRTADWAYMRYRDGSEELYEMDSDPKQFHNLAGKAEHAGQLLKMREALDRRLAGFQR